MIERSARPAATVSDPPVSETDWLVVDGGLLWFVLGDVVTVYVPETQLGVVSN